MRNSRIQSQVIENDRTLIIQIRSLIGIRGAGYSYAGINNQIVFIKTKDNVMLDEAMAVAITSDRISLQSDRSLPVLFEMNGITDSDKSGRDYLAKYGWLLTQQVGIYSNTYRSFTVASFYLHISKPTVFTKLFRKESDAMAFLEFNTHEL